MSIIRILKINTIDKIFSKLKCTFLLPLLNRGLKFYFLKRIYEFYLYIDSNLAFLDDTSNIRGIFINSTFLDKHYGCSGRKKKIVTVHIEQTE